MASVLPSIRADGQYSSVLRILSGRKRVHNQIIQEIIENLTVLLFNFTVSVCRSLRETSFCFNHHTYINNIPLVL